MKKADKPRHLLLLYLAVWFSRTNVLLTPSPDCFVCKRRL